VNTTGNEHPQRATTSSYVTPTCATGTAPALGVVRAQINQICTATEVLELDRQAALNGGFSRFPSRWRHTWQLPEDDLAAVAG
jgi:hypothetical protein